MIEYTPDVLRNRGIPVVLAVLDTNGEQSGTETIYVRFTMNTLADIEERWGSTLNWQVAVAEKPVTTTRATLALALGYIGTAGEFELGRRMLTAQNSAYGAAIGGAWALANGVDPFALAESLNAALAPDATAEEILTPTQV